ncbi:MAG: hypothetical protein HZC22_09515 [Rhodocyclales bacterium]|nr:hypothetical protein [Rhodocyclales bacterium]
MKYSGMLKMTFIHWLVIALVVAYLADWLMQRPDGRARDINAVIDAKGSAALRNYPYKFRVVRVSGDTAVLATPRNVSVPAFRFLGIIHPGIDVKNPNDPAFIAAEKELAAVQSEAMTIARAQEGIKGVQWELDRAWLARHGIDVPN